MARDGRSKPERVQRIRSEEVAAAEPTERQKVAGSWSSVGWFFGLVSELAVDELAREGDTAARQDEG